MFNRKYYFKLAYNVAIARVKKSIEGDEDVKEKINKYKLKAKDVPLFCYVQQKGESLSQAMTMIYALKTDDLKAYLGVYIGDNLYTDEISESYYFVLYRLNPFNWYVAYFENMEEEISKYDIKKIPIWAFWKFKKEIWIYDPYDPENGQREFFGSFFKNPIIHLKMK